LLLQRERTMIVGIGFWRDWSRWWWRMC
jgi:hypothetical protein